MISKFVYCLFIGYFISIFPNLCKGTTSSWAAWTALSTQKWWEYFYSAQNFHGQCCHKSEDTPYCGQWANVTCTYDLDTGATNSNLYSWVQSDEDEWAQDTFYIEQINVDREITSQPSFSAGSEWKYDLEGRISDEDAADEDKISLEIDFDVISDAIADIYKQSYDLFGEVQGGFEYVTSVNEFNFDEPDFPPKIEWPYNCSIHVYLRRTGSKAQYHFNFIITYSKAGYALAPGAIAGIVVAWVALWVWIICWGIIVALRAEKGG